MLKRDIELLYEISSLRQIPRGWAQHLGGKPANVLEHTLRVMLLALTIARMEKVKNEELVIKMALFHDLAESRTADHSYIQKVYVEIDEERAVNDLFDKTILDDIPALIKKYEARKCIEAQIVRDADNLDIDLELKEYENTGHKLPAKWKNTSRRIVKKSLYTKSARLIWDEIQKSDPDSWHLKANKYYKIKNSAD